MRWVFSALIVGMGLVACSGVPTSGQDGEQSGVIGGTSNIGGNPYPATEWNTGQAGRFNGSTNVPDAGAAGGDIAVSTGGRTGSEGGAPATNGGEPAVGNGGATTGNSSDPVVNGGTTASDGGAPASEGGAPASEGGAPVASGGESAVASGGATSSDPSSNGGTSVGAGGATASEGGVPVASGGEPTVGNGGATTGNSSDTVVNGGAPASDGGAPASDGGAPASEGGAPVASGGEPNVASGGATSSDPSSNGGTSVGAGGAPISSTGSGVGQLSFTGEPTFTGNDNVAAPQVGLVRIDTNLPVTGTVAVSGGDEAWTVALGVAATSHETTILGLKPDTSYHATVSASDGIHELTSQELEWRTPALPNDFPRLQFVASNPSQMEPGMTLFNVRGPYYLIVVDNVGQVRWYYHGKPAENDHRLLANGHLIFPSSQREITEIDWRGNVVACWYAKNYPYSFVPPTGSIAVDAQTFHHSVREMPNGNLLALTTETRTVRNYPTSTADPTAGTATARITGDIVLEFTRTGDVVKKVALLDILDPKRVGYNATDASWITSGAKDWSHSNSAIYDPASDSYIVSSRHQDTVIKIDRETGTLVWILGTHSNWGAQWQNKLLQPIGDFTWQYHQHAADLIPDSGASPGTVVLGLFDNGNNRAAAFETPQANYSRAVSYVIDEQHMTVAQLWSYGAESGPDFFFSMSMSDADWQPTTGNVLITAGRLQTTDPQGGPKDYSQIFEVNAAGSRVFDMLVRAEDSSATDYTTFNGKRIADIRSAGFGQD